MHSYRPRHLRRHGERVAALLGDQNWAKIHVPMEFRAKWIVIIRQAGSGSPLVLVFSGCPEVVEVAEDKVLWG